MFVSFPDPVPRGGQLTGVGGIFKGVGSGRLYIWIGYGVGDPRIGRKRGGPPHGGTQYDG